MLSSSRVAEPPTISYQQYVALIRRWDRDTLIRAAGWASAEHAGPVVVDGRASRFLPWNVAGMAVTAICRGTVGGPRPNADQLYELCWQFGNIIEPDIDSPDAGIRIMTRILHEQLPYQLDRLNEWSRAQALFVDTDFPPAHIPEVMSQGWVNELLGASIPEYAGAGFVLWASAMSAHGEYGLAVWDESLDALLEILPLERIQEIGREHFVTDIAGIKAERIAIHSAVQGVEKFAFNPLIARPFLSDVVAGSWIAPSADLVAQKMSSLGVIHAGMEKWGTKFTRDLGRLFEAYVGKNLSLIRGAQVSGEVPYGSRKFPRVTTDWIVVLESFVVLVEVKATSPTESIRQSAGNLFGDLSEKFSKAVTQLNDTVEAIREDRTRFNHVPLDRPMIGFVVTLGNFPTASLAYGQGVFGRSDIPLGFLGAGDLEFLVARSPEEISRLLASLCEEVDSMNLLNERSLRVNAPRGKNKLIEDAWFSNPVLQFIEERQNSNSGTIAAASGNDLSQT